jgi:hypothetical protein
MTPEQAETFAADLYDGHPCAGTLLMESQHAARPEDRRRAWYALLALDPMQPLPESWPTVDVIERWRGGPLDGVARGIADVLLVVFYSSDKSVRRRAAAAMAAFCGEAAAVKAALERAA